MASSAGRPNERLIGRLPKVGIRPIIDGRWGGVRESLESVTLAMARAAADLIRAANPSRASSPIIASAAWRNRRGWPSCSSAKAWRSPCP
jgi:hypothetical protein